MQHFIKEVAPSWSRLQKAMKDVRVSLPAFWPSGYAEGSAHWMIYNAIKVNEPKCCVLQWVTTGLDFPHATSWHGIVLSLSHIAIFQPQGFH